MVVDLTGEPVGEQLRQLDGLATLHSLKLGFSGVDLATVATLDLPALRWLDLSGLGGVRGEGAPVSTAVDLAPLLESPLWGRLETLVLARCHLDRGACRALATACPPLPPNLVLDHTTLDDAEALLAGLSPNAWALSMAGGQPIEALQACPSLAGLGEVTLAGLRCDDTALAGLVGQFERLRWLDLRDASVGPETLRALGRNTSPLFDLVLSGNGLGDDSLDAILSGDWGPEVHLDLSENRFTEAAFSRLVARFGDRVRGAEVQDATEDPCSV